VTGAAAVAKRLSTSNGTWDGSPTSFSYQWLRCSANATHCSAIPGADAAKYTVAKADTGHALMAQVSATNAAATVPATSLPTDVVVGALHLRHKPHITGIAKVGERLRETGAKWTKFPATVRYEWQRCSAKGTSCRPIAGATGSSHVLTAQDANHRLRVEVTGINLAGRSTSTSAPSAVVKT
jgi:hypothetical protein